MARTSGWWAALGIAAACAGADTPAVPGDDAPVMFEVPKGASASSLTEALEGQRLISGAFGWKWFLRSADASCVKAGRHELRRAMTMREVLAALCAAPIPVDEPFTVVEGWRIREIDAELAKRGWIKAGEYAKLAENKAVDVPFAVTSPTLEGYLYPETYRVEPKTFTPKAFIERQLATFQSKFLKNAELGERSLHEIVVMASMIEREEPTPANRPLVAGILWKRIGAGWNLGVDATSRYTLAEWNHRQAFLTQLRDPADPYNTRLRKGLPPTAIGNPGVEALNAALHPQASEYWYYLHDAQGQIHGGRDVAEHEANRAKYNVY